LLDFKLSIDTIKVDEFWMVLLFLLNFYVYRTRNPFEFHLHLGLIKSYLYFSYCLSSLTPYWFGWECARNCQNALNLNPQLWHWPMLK